ncbi:hypothetical protein BLNAU_8335 [Blattamonas nauphoetae]|uniref:Ice nucleation protein n=1 Tax=Blattamonas nauphoetae TaxID=2049346 RepID=A0ABQ9XYY1_9EUKA|nr:hypothetical protein BLNAU_8335 [Blattamonas nauphoetae]
MSGASTLSLKSVSFVSMKNEASGDVVMKNSTNTTNIGPFGYHLYPHTNGAVFMSEGFWDHGKCGQERLPCSSLDFAFSLLTQTKTEISLGSNITLSTLLECPETGASISSSSEASLLFVSDGQIILEVGSLTLSSIDITLPSSLSQSLLVVKGSTLTLSSTVTITTPPSAAHTASLFKIEGGRLALSGTVFFFASRRRHLFSLKREGTLDEIKMEGASTMYVSTGCEFKTISQTESGGGAFLSTNGNNNQILSIASSSFESVSSVGDGGVILAPFPLTPTAALVDMHRRWNTVNTSDDVPLVLFLADVGSTGFASSSGSDGELCGFSVNPCSSIDLVQTRLAANGSKTEGKLKPITIELQKGLAQSTPFSCGGHKATITGNTITLSKTGQFTTSSADSVLTLSSLTILFASSQTQPVISVSTGSVVVSGCTIRNGDADIPAVFGSVSGGLLELSGTNTMKLVSTSSSLFDVTSGTLKIGSRTSLTHSTTQRTSSLFVLNGGSTLSSTA